MSDSATLPGGWNPYQNPTQEDLAVFNEATNDGHFGGVDYQPLSVSTQIVAGTNYKFKCGAENPPPAIAIWEAIVVIFKPHDGPPYVTSIHNI